MHEDSSREVVVITSGSTSLLAPPLGKDRRLTDFMKKRSKFNTDNTTTDRSSVANAANSNNPTALMNLK